MGLNEIGVSVQRTLWAICAAYKATISVRVIDKETEALNAAYLSAIHDRWLREQRAAAMEAALRHIESVYGRR